jgi:hypothetical protein
MIDSFVYCDVSKLPAPTRTQLSMLGFDIVDCSNLAGKPGQVDLRIIARALKPSGPYGVDRPAVVIISGDGDFAYCVSCLRNAAVPTMILYNSDNTSSVHTVLLEVAEYANGVSFAGRTSEDPESLDEQSSAKAATDDVGGVHQSLNENTEKSVASRQISLLESIERSSELDGGWKLASEVGSLFKILQPNGGNKFFKLTKYHLLQSGIIECTKDASDRDKIRLVPKSPPEACCL